MGEPPGSPVIVAHRGLWRSSNLVENSFSAFAMAVSAGFPAECDVWPSADGEPVVMHDQTLERTTFGQGLVSSYTAKQLKEVRLRRSDADERIPLLGEVANLVSYVEVKAPDSPEFVRRVIALMGAGESLLQSFDERTIQYAREVNPSLRVAFLADDARGFEVALQRGWAVHADHLILDVETVARFRARDLRIGAWTVNSDRDIRHVVPWGLDVIISDEPARVRQLMADARSGHATKP